MLKKILFKLKKQILKDAYQRAEEKIEKISNIKRFVQVAYFKYLSTNNFNNSNEIYTKYKYLFEP